MSRIDARLREMQFLAKLDRDGSQQITGPYDASPERQMVISLLHDGYLNGIDSAVETAEIAYAQQDFELRKKIGKRSPPRLLTQGDVAV